MRISLGSLSVELIELEHLLLANFEKTHIDGVVTIRNKVKHNKSVIRHVSDKIFLFCKVNGRILVAFSAR